MKQGAVLIEEGRLADRRRGQTLFEGRDDRAGAHGGGFSVVSWSSFTNGLRAPRRWCRRRARPEREAPEGGAPENR